MGRCTVLLVIACFSSIFGDINGEICWSDVCEFHMEVKQQRTMSYTYKNSRGRYTSRAVGVTPNGTLQAVPNGFYKTVGDGPVNASDVITADGATRTVITINGQFPGPTIEVAEGSQVVVRVMNRLLSESISIHWHGIHQKHTPWMDGTPHITNCPIQPYQTFTYRFKATPSGTHWYHSHMEVQKADGLFGMLIVHKKEDKNTAENEDSVPLVVTDWFHYDGVTMDVTNAYRTHFPPGTGEFMLHSRDRGYSIDNIELSGLKYESGLMNGRGRFNNKTPLFETTIKPNSTKRFRSVNAASEFAFKISIDEHELTVLSLDGNEVVPYTVDFVILYPGERVDFKIHGDQLSSLYWIRAKTLIHGVGPNSNHEIKAKLIYEGATLADDNSDPVSSQKDCTQTNPCKILNCPFPNYPNSSDICVPISDMKDLRPSVFSGNETHKEEFLNFEFARGSSVNNIKFVAPKAPWNEPNNGEVPCAVDCPEKGCDCTHELHFPLNQVVRLTLVNMRDPSAFAHHPVHLHGFTFEVLKTGYPVINETTGEQISRNMDIVCDTTPICSRVHWKEGHPKNLNFDHPPRKDTVLIPAGGYAIIQFIADNPGYWLMHCHPLLHVTEGMALVVNVAREHQGKPPRGFPTCNTFDWSSEDYDIVLATEGAQTSNTRCLSEGKAYDIGEGIPSKDGCNTCTCGIAGEWECTERACATKPPSPVVYDELTFWAVVGALAGVCFILILAVIYLLCTRPSTKDERHPTDGNFKDNKAYYQDKTDMYM